MKIRLSTKCMKGVPLVNCDETFTFIVNNQEYKSTKITAFLLSPLIQKNYSFDATYNEMTINTNNKGNFQNILDLTKFQSIEIPENETAFVIEVIQQLTNKFIRILEDTKNITMENIIEKIKYHEKFPFLYEKQINEEINFISMHLSAILNTQNEDFKKLSIDTIEKVLQNPNLKRRNDEQILTMINELYLTDSSYSILYEYVNFTKISSTKMKSFSDNFEINDLTNGIWMKLKQRLNQDFNLNEENVLTVPLNNSSVRKETIKKEYTVKELIEFMNIHNAKSQNEEESESESDSYDCIW